MKVIKAFPPNFKQIAATFPVKGKQGILYAFGDRLYNPSGVPVPPWIMAHEEEHAKRQEAIIRHGDQSGVEAWWDLYLRDSYFRYYEELFAHRVELKSYQQYSDKSSNDYLDLLAKRLSSPLYALNITYDEARKRIQSDG